MCTSSHMVLETDIQNNFISSLANKECTAQTAISNNKVAYNITSCFSSVPEPCVVGLGQFRSKSMLNASQPQYYIFVLIPLFEWVCIYAPTTATSNTF